MTDALSRLLGRLPIGWLQLIHNRTRLAAALAGVMFANILIFMQLGFLGALVESIEYVHEYQGAPLAEGEKSVSYRLVAGASDRTLSNADVTAIRDGIIDGMRGLGYELRI